MKKEKNKTLENMKNIKWLVPGWIFYEFYKSCNGKKSKKIFGGAKAEVIRIAATASFPFPGTYVLTTAGLALLKKKIDSGEIKEINLRSFKDFIPLSKLKYAPKNVGKPYLKIYFKDKSIHFEVFYKE